MTLKSIADCSEFETLSYASKTFNYVIGDENQEALTFDMNQDMTLDDSFCDDVGDGGSYEIFVVTLIEPTGSRLTKNEEFLREIGMEEIHQEGTDAIEYLVFSNIFDYSLEGMVLEITIKRTLGTNFDFPTFYIAFEISCGIT